VDHSFVLKRCQLKDIEPEGLRVSMKEMWKGCSYSVFLAAKHAFGQDDVRVLDTMIPGGSKVVYIHIFLQSSHSLYTVVYCIPMRCVLIVICCVALYNTT
jgi:hypothetical protein